MTIRTPESRDWEVMARIYNHAIAHTEATAEVEPIDAKNRAKWVAERLDAGLPVLIAEEGGAVVGYAGASAYRSRFGYRYTVENSVYVAPEAQGRGVGAALLTELIDRLRACGFRMVVAAIAGDNEASVRLHRRCGFVFTARMPRLVHKFGRWIDVIYMTLDLQPNEPDDFRAVETRVVPFDHTDFSSLHRELAAFLAELNGEADAFYATHNQADEGMTMVVAYVDGRPVGGGALRQKDPSSVEIKRMYVRPSARRQGVGAAALARLESEARAQGFRRTILETSRRLTAAVALYERAGYARIPNYPPYEGVEDSVCYAKEL